MSKIRVGIIGAGWAGRTHAEALRYAPEAELVAIADPKFGLSGTGSNTNMDLDKLYGVDLIATPEEMIERKDIDAIFIASPHQYHNPQTLYCAKAGKHVFVEKPMATSVEDCQEMINACEQAGVKLMVGHFSRFREPAQAVKLVLESGKLGRVLMMREVMVDPSEGGWRYQSESKGVLLGYGVNSIDRIRWWLGCEVEKVCSLSSHFRGNPTEDGSQLLMLFTNGAEVSLMCTDIWPVNDPLSPGAVPATSMILCEKGVIDINMYGDVKVASQGPWETISTLRKWDSPNSFERIRAYALQARDFIDSISKEHEPSISGKDGLAAVKIALAAYKSSEIGEWVNLI